ncbi:phosphatase PAP2 family protein [Streptomyces sp. NPDC046685]|uniref:phosphatase PAP2 family protein n=1 Tax=Streptomyces sp. NPDC046685 TaxID=3157202 RepID=UPI0033C890D7
MSTRGHLPSCDASVHHWVLAHRNHGMVRVAIVVTDSGTGWAAYTLAAAAGALADRHRRWRGLLAAVAVLAAGQGVRITVAALIGRARPPSADWAWHASGPAMPSGHTTTSAIVAALLTVALARSLKGRRMRLPLCCLPVLWALCVGASRVYLGMHWPGDVVAGWLLATAWTTLLAALPLWLGRRRQRFTPITSSQLQGRTT